MTRYYKIDEQGNRIEFPGYIVTDHGSVYYNPTESLILQYGWIKEVVPDPEPEVLPQGEPDMDTVLSKLKVLALPTLEAMDDEAALVVMECFPTWESLIGKQVEQGKRIWDDGYLWKVMQTHTVQEQYRPSIDTASLYAKVQAPTHEGTIDNPIPFSLNMELVEGLYYIDEGVKYLCTRSLAAAYWPLAELVGQYVEVIS